MTTSEISDNRQDSDFFFLTGFEEPEAYAIFEKSGQVRRFTLPPNSSS